MQKLSKLFLTAVGVAALIAFLLVTLLERVPPAQIAVRQNLWGGGVAKQDFLTGFKFGVTGLHKWHYLDRRTHFLTWAEFGRDSQMGRTLAPLEVRNKDNNTVSFDLTVTYRIKEGEAYQLVEEGNHLLYRSLVEDAVAGLLREELAKMGSEDVYSTEVRLARALETLPLLEASLAKYHVQPELLLIRSVRFPPGYEERLQQKQLTYQKRELAQAEKLLEDQKGITETIQAEIEAAVKEAAGDRDKKLQTLSSDNTVAIAEVRREMEIYDRTTRAEADADYETMIAEGNLAIAKAEALRNELRNQALDTIGGRIYLAQQAAENLQFESVTLNSNDPSIPSVINIDEMMDLLLGKRD